MTRPLLSGMLRFAVVDGVWRSGKSKEYVWPQGALRAAYCTRLRVKLLEPLPGDGSEHERFVLSSLSPTFTLRAHDRSILYEVPSKNIHEIKFGMNQLRLSLDKSAIDAWHKVSNASVPWEPSKKKKAADKVYFTEDDFQRNPAGRSNVLMFVESMIQDYEVMFGKLISSEGIIRISKDKAVEKADLLARLPSYFNRYAKTSTHYQSLSKHDKQCGCLAMMIYDNFIVNSFVVLFKSIDFYVFNLFGLVTIQLNSFFFRSLFNFRFGLLVLKELMSMSPCPTDHRSKFRNWLAKIYYESAEPLQMKKANADDI